MLGWKGVSNREMGCVRWVTRQAAVEVSDRTATGAQ